MSEMVERVAKALWEQYSTTFRPWAEAGPYEKDKLYADAKAAIEAMRNPTAAMLFVGSNDDAGFTAVNLLASWELMINEALK